MDRRIRQQSFGHRLGALLGLGGVVGRKIDLEAVGRAEGVKLEAELFEGLFGRFGFRIEDAAFQADGHGRGVGGHWRGFGEGRGKLFRSPGCRR